MKFFRIFAGGLGLVARTPISALAAAPAGGGVMAFAPETTAVEAPPRPARWRKLPVVEALGPGLITGASDDDPSGIATYSQVGAQFGYGLGWTLVATYPLMAAIQEISARIGCITHRGIAGNIRRYYPTWLLHAVVALLVAANVANLGADIGAMGSALQLLVGGSAQAYACLFGALCVALQVCLSYRSYVGALKWLTLSLFAYVAAVLVVGVDWNAAVMGALVPSFAFDAEHATALVAVLGTTISPYLFFWQSAQEVEDRKGRTGLKPLRVAKAEAPAEIARIRLDTRVGMAFANFVALSIIVTTAATLNANGITDIATSADAAEALRPIAGPFAFAVFALGIIGTGLLAVPVLAGSAAYALGEALRWPVGHGRRPMEAKAFYGTIAGATLIGLALNFTPIDPIKALFWSAVLNGVLAPPLMAVMVLMASNARVMGRLVLPPRLRHAGWLATAVMGLTVVGMVASWL
jgi:NRAMP (natural resistance-associated macrophage protein)-like metal ion transporter